MNIKEVTWQKRFLVLGILALMIFISYKIVKPYILTVITTFVLAYLVHPLYKKLFDKIENRTLSALISILATVIVIFGPLFFIMRELQKQIGELISSSEFDSLVQKVVPFFQDKLGFNLLDLMDKAKDYGIEIVRNLAMNLPTILISLVLVILGMFYILINWETLGKHLKKFLPVDNKDNLSKELKEKTNAIIYGSVLMAILEALVAFIGFSLLGIDLSVLLAILIFFLAFIPAVGPIIVWLPVAAYFFFTGNVPFALVVVGLGLIMGYGIDTFLRAKVLGKNTGINPFLLILGIVGGISIFGIFGFIIGPLILTYTIKIIEHFLDK
jgi:predicted PurR-regulated permease PerM